MRRRTPRNWTLLLPLLMLAGCHQGDWWVPQPYHQSQIRRLHEAQLAAQQQQQNLTQQAGVLDNKNDEMSSLLAQSERHVDVLRSDLTSVRSRLKQTAADLEKARLEKTTAEKRVEDLLASTRARGGAIITANNSLTGNLAAINLPGIDVRRDGDVIRVRLPSDQLFPSGGTPPQLGREATSLLSRVGGELAHSYPDQKIAIEGHTGRDPVARSVADAHLLTTNQAMAVYQQLIAGRRLAPEQLFVVGHGSNQPIYSNADQAGRRGNSRIELVIYPDRIHGR